MNIYPLDTKFASFGFDVINIDGHNYEEIIAAFDKFKANKGSGRPTVVIAKTFMGKGVSFMHDQYGWHGNPPKPEQAEQALSELV
jgi:transketolase